MGLAKVLIDELEKGKSLEDVQALACVMRAAEKKKLDDAIESD